MVFFPKSSKNQKPGPPGGAEAPAAREYPRSSMWARIPWFTLLCLGTAAWFFIHRHLFGVWACLLIDFAWSLIGGARPAQGAAGGERRLPPSAPLSQLLVWVFLGLVAASLPSFHWIFPWVPDFDHRFTEYILFFLLARLWITHRQLADAPDPSDLSPRVSRVALGVILLASVFMRFYDLDVPPGPYWDDWAENIMDTRNMTDMHDFKFVITAGTHEPFFQYFTAVLCWMFPHASALVIERSSLALLGVLAVWLFYLLGKEVGGRRVGLLAAGFASVSKPLIMMSVILLRFNTMTMWVAAGLLMFFRLIKKPDLRHFLQWGAVSSVGAYTYPAYRPFIPFLILSSLVWVWTDKRERELKTWEKVFLGLSGLGLAGFFAFSFNVWRYPNIFGRILRESGFFVPGILLSLLIPWFVRFCQEAWPGGRHPKLSAWASGTLVCVLLSTSMMAHPMILERLSQLTVYQFRSFIDLYRQVALKFSQLLEFLFYALGGGRDCLIREDSFFDFSGTLLVALGISYAWSRWEGRRLFLFLAACIGVSTYMLSVDPHAGKVLAATVPLLLLGAMAVERLLRTLGGVWGFERPNRMALWFLAGFMLWSGLLAFDRIYLQWMTGYWGNNSLMAVQARKDARDFNVYLADYADYTSYFTNPLSQAILLEKVPIRILYMNNILETGSDAIGKDVVFYMGNYDQRLERAILRAYPRAEIKPIRMPNRPEVGSVFQRAWIPWSDLVAADRKWARLQKRGIRWNGKRGLNRVEPRFRIQAPGKGVWSRTFYFHFLMCKGLIWAEDRVDDLNVPPSRPYQWGPFTARFKRKLHVEAPGRYAFESESVNPFMARLDGKMLLDDRPIGDRRMRKISVKAVLEPGEHELELLVDYHWGDMAPNLYLRKPGVSLERQADKLTTIEATWTPTPTPWAAPEPVPTGPVSATNGHGTLGSGLHNALYITGTPLTFSLSRKYGIGVSN